MENYKQRIADKILDKKLKGKGAVLIQGPKWCGKTTTAEQISNSILYMSQPEDKNQNLTLVDIKEGEDMKKFLKYTLIIFAFVLVIYVKDRVSAIANSGTCTYKNVEFSFPKLSSGYLHCEAMKLLNGNTKIIYSDTIDNVPVVSIGGVISDSKNIRNVVASVELPSELTNIANNAFYRCTNLKTVKIKGV